ncbi:MGMT family protein [Vibrio salinus]|uniref:MGMT family protein n=1 Tax=Vibrio salinus TaxID=2899784 RepID=UPI001E2B8788|nr:MGMT family protein [Vibrio salinus]MCE0494686.1 MGMT family protein [Vibrio salinus]
MNQNSHFQNHFLASVFSVVNSIPKGRVSTYGDVARMAGFPGYARHVGKALSKIPPDSQLPWYRVVNSKGCISLKGEDYQRQLNKLTEEEITVRQSGSVSLRQYRWEPQSALH